MRRVGRVVMAGAVAVVLLAAAGCTTPAQRSQMSRQTLVSTAVEGARLARLIIDDQAGGTFARTHAQELADDVQKVEEDLADHPATDGKQLLDLAEQVDRSLGEMTIKPTDHGVARTAERTLTSLASRISGGAS